MRKSLIIAVALILGRDVSAQQQVDILIRGGTVVDGTGAAPRVADVGIRGDRIVFVGPSTNVTAVRTIDAKGLVVAPGFIDPHTHTEGDLSSAQAPRRATLPYLMQGVTTVITHNDGGGSVDIARTLDNWTKTGIGTNAAVYIGQGSVRGRGMGMSAATPPH